MTKCSLVVIGTELTRGIIADRHGQLVSKEMTHIGVHMSEIVAIPDDGTITPVLRALKKNNDIIIVTGGLGPTQDDMTRKCIAEVFSTTLVRDEKCFETLRKRVGENKALGANEKQAYIPKGFTVMENPNGTAPGFYGSDCGTYVFALPGPPREMEPMFYSSVLPKVKDLLDIEDVERYEYSSFITAEARLEELTERYEGIDWATRFQDYKISLYASSSDKTKIDLAFKALSAELGPYRLVEGNTSALDILIERVKEKGALIAAAESCTGGLLSSLLTSKPGASDFFLGSVVSYNPSVKMDVLGVKRETVERYGVVSDECALQMADGVREVCGADYSVSVTGVAGPGESEGKKVGTVSFGFSSKERKSVSFTLHFSSWGRESIRRKAAVVAMLALSAYINGEDVVSISREWTNI